MRNRSTSIWLVGLALAAASLFVLGWWPNWVGGEPLLSTGALGASVCILVGLCLSRLALVGVRLTRLEAELRHASRSAEARGPKPLAAPPVLSHRLRELGLEEAPLQPPASNGKQPSHGAPHAA